MSKNKCTQKHRGNKFAYSHIITQEIFAHTIKTHRGKKGAPNHKITAKIGFHICYHTITEDRRQRRKREIRG